MIKVFLLTTVILSIALVGMAFNILFRNKRFPETHVGHNKEMHKRGIICAKTMHKIEQKKANEGLRYKNLSLIKK
ncbi:MAG: hypothetical protein WCX31_03870 [Salinivirgaceae bacterium]